MDGDRTKRYFALIAAEAESFVAFSATTSDAWKRSLFPSLVGSDEMLYTEEAFQEVLADLASHIDDFQAKKAVLRANQEKLAAGHREIEALMKELLSEELTENAALIKEELSLKKEFLQEKKQ